MNIKTENLLVLEDIRREYVLAGTTYSILQGIDLTINKGEFLALMGPSGSGKSTLLNIIGCLDTPTSGRYILEDKDVSKMTVSSLAEVRNKHIGFIFQNFNLIPSISVIDNVLLPSFYLGNEDRQKAEELLVMVGLKDRINYRPNDLSGGQKQRVAIARSLINNPNLILADEPTGALDSKTGHEIMELILSLNRDQHKTVLMVTHDLNIANMAHKIIELADGKIKK
ncbi:MAG: ABC transporter ATP-binding protein [Candidatus Shapirobacteria bacterium]